MGTGEPGEPQHLGFFWRRGGGDVLVELAGFGFRDVLLGEPSDDHLLTSPEGAGDQDFVAGLQFTIGFGGVAVEVHLAALACVRGLRTRAKETRDVEPDVQAHLLILASSGTLRDRPVVRDFVFSVAKATLSDRVDRLTLLHVIHDFLPRHRAGSEIYAFELGRELSKRHDVTVLCAEYDPSRPHGEVTWRLHEGLAVVEIVNNWVTTSFAGTYRPPVINEQIAHVIHALQPDVVHIHNLLNLSFDLPAMARAMGIPVVATLHDYTLVCASGGQRIHIAEAHQCDVIDTARCARCFRESPFQAQSSLGVLTTAWPGALQRMTARALRRFPRVAKRGAAAARAVSPLTVTPEDLDARLAAAREVFESVDLFLAPSRSIAGEFINLGIAPTKIKVSDYGFVPMRRGARPAYHGPLRIGYVGTLTWHKGVHILIAAARLLMPAPYQLKIFGDPHVFPDYVAGLRAQSADLPVRFMGKFDRERTADVYDEIDVLVVPSLWLENSPLVIHEAFQAGIPIVGARIGGIAELVAHGQHGWLYEPTSAAELAAALRDLIDHPHRIAEFSRSLPPVMTLEQDAREREAEYLALRRP